MTTQWNMHMAHSFAELEVESKNAAAKWAAECARPTRAQWTEEYYKMLAAPWEAQQQG